MEQTPVITVKELTKRYGDFTAVDRVSFEVKKGEIFAFLGPNGAGKTTTIKMLTTLLEPTQGSITLNGFDVKRDPENVRRSFGIVFQDPSIDTELTAFENMEFHAVLYGLAKEMSRKRIKDLLTLVELWERKDELAKNFSGGMKRRLEIARGLLHHPTVLFLDEPTIGLDPQTRNHLWNYIADLNRSEGITVFMTTHYIEEAEKAAHRVAVIDHGRIVADGSVEDLKAETGKSDLEGAFLELTGRSIRDEEASSAEHNRLRARAWHRS